MVGAGPYFILVFAHHSHRINLFRKSRYLNRNLKSPSRAIASSCIPSITCEYVSIVKATLEYPSVPLIAFGLAFPAGSGFRFGHLAQKTPKGKELRLPGSLLRLFPRGPIRASSLPQALRALCPAFSVMDNRVNNPMKSDRAEGAATLYPG